MQQRTPGRMLDRTTSQAAAAPVSAPVADVIAAEPEVLARLAQRERAMAALATQLAAESRRHAETRERLTQSEKVKLLGEFVGNIVHDLNNVLTVLDGVFTLVQLAPDKPLPDDVRLTGERSIRHGETLLRQLLDFVQAGRSDTAALALGAVVDESKEAIRLLVGPDVLVAVSCADDVWPVVARHGAIESVLLNLAANARDAMPQGGTLQIVVANCAVGERPPALREGEYVRIAVTDTGRGMPAEVRARAGQLFFTTKPRGTGLGLASAFHLAETANGCVTIDSEPCRGTTVTLFLARAATHGVMPDLASLAMDPDRHGRATILLVDRDDSARAVLGDLLRRLRYTVIEASSAEMALGVAFAAISVDLLLADGQTASAGLDLAAELRRSNAALPVIYLGDDGGVEAGVVLPKPVYEPLLARALLEQLGRLPAMVLTPRALQAAARLRERLHTPRARDLFDRWFGISRSAGRLPTLDELIAPPFALPDHGHIMAVLDTGAAPAFRVVRIGEALARRLDRDMTGELITGGNDTVWPSLPLAYRRSLTGHAYFDYAKFTLARGGHALFERLLLPVSQDRRGITHLVGLVTLDNIPSS